MHENAKSSKIVSNMKNVNIVQQQLEIINSKLDFLTSVISDKYLSSFVHSQELSRAIEFALFGARMKKLWSKYQDWFGYSCYLKLNFKNEKHLDINRHPGFW
jgi:hypothetical protein